MGALEMSALIVLTIGPVQSYISQARRTQDLWQGSRILSYLASKGVHYAMNQSQAEVIYPIIDPPETNNTDNTPNQLVIRWDGDEAGARACAEAMENAIRAAWQTLSANTLNYFSDSLALDERETVMSIWQEQEKNWLECYWVVVQEDQNKTDPNNDYSRNITKANAALGARKLLRNFPQIHEPGRKCSITGEHEALRGKGDYVVFWKARKAEQRNLALLGKSERLSAISTIKRFAHEEVQNNREEWIPINPPLKIDHRFPSTSSIAAAPFKYAVLRNVFDSSIDADMRDQLQRKLEIFLEKLLVLFEDPAIQNQTKRRNDAERLLFFIRRGSLNPERFPYIEENLGKDVVNHELAQRFLSIDGDFLFEDTLISKTIEEYSGRPPSSGHMTDARQTLEGLLKAASALDIPKPSPYLVILSMDGDHMGKTLGVLQTRDQHRQFSETLANFARHNVKRIVEQEHLGRVIYAGGDDVLALLPLQDALLATEKLRSEFEQTVASINIRNHKGEPLTASTGLAFVHHTHNLQDAVRAAHNAQERAKNEYDRSAVGVEFLRRSGEPRSMGHKWVNPKSRAIIGYINDLVEAFNGALSHNLPYDIAQITYSMSGKVVPVDAIQAELLRILRRRLAIQDKIVRNKKADDLLDILIGLKANYTWHNVQAWLELARFVAQNE